MVLPNLFNGNSNQTEITNYKNLEDNIIKTHLIENPDYKTNFLNIQNKMNSPEDIYFKKTERKSLKTFISDKSNFYKQKSL